MREASPIHTNDLRLQLAHEHAAELAREWAIANRGRTRRELPALPRRRDGGPLRSGQTRLVRVTRISIGRIAIALGRAIGGPEVA